MYSIEINPLSDVLLKQVHLSDDFREYDISVTDIRRKSLLKVRRKFEIVNNYVCVILILSQYS